MGKLTEFGRKLIKGRNDYSPKVKKILEEIGDEPITEMYIMRTPISKILRFLMNVVSLGSFEKKLKETPYDDLYHLALHIRTAKGLYSLEKNEVISMTRSPKKPKNAQTMSVSIPSGVSINKLLELTKERMGGRYFVYSARDTNCQDFIMNILQANGLDSSENMGFVKQSTKELFSSHLRKFSNTVTDLAGKVDVLKQGGNIAKKSTENVYTSSMDVDKMKKEKADELAKLIVGSGIFDDIGNWFTGASRDVGNWTKKAVKDVKKTFTGKSGKRAGKTAISGATTALGSTLGLPGGIVGKIAGDELGDAVIGKGMKRKGRFPKGSQEAKDHMARLRAMRNK